MQTLLQYSWRKLWEWIRRYVPQEAVGTSVAVLAAQFVRPWLMESGLTWAKTFGVGIIMAADIVAYYLYGIVREWLRHRRELKRSRTKSAIHATIDVMTDTTLAGTINSLSFRPYFLFNFPTWVGDATYGTLLAQLCAAITLRAMVIPCYELRKRFWK